MADLSLLSPSLCISLPKRRDRREAAVCEFRRIGIVSTFFPAVPAASSIPQSAVARWRRLSTRKNIRTYRIQAYIAVARTMVQVMHYAIQRQWAHVAIFEDDVLFHPQFCSIWEKEQIPEAEFIGFGCARGDRTDWAGYKNIVAQRQRKQVLGNWYTPQWIISSHAYIVHASMYSTLQQIWKQEVEPTDQAWNFAWDGHAVIYREPPLAAQRASRSDIMNTWVVESWHNQEW